MKENCCDKTREKVGVKMNEIKRKGKHCGEKNNEDIREAIMRKQNRKIQ